MTTFPFLRLQPYPESEPNFPFPLCSTLIVNQPRLGPFLLPRSQSATPARIVPTQPLRVPPSNELHYMSVKARKSDVLSLCHHPRCYLCRLLLTPILSTSALDVVTSFCDLHQRLQTPLSSMTSTARRCFPSTASSPPCITLRILPASSCINRRRARLLFYHLMSDLRRTTCSSPSPASAGHATSKIIH